MLENMSEIREQENRKRQLRRERENRRFKVCRVKYSIHDPHNDYGSEMVDILYHGGNDEVLEQFIKNQFPPKTRPFVNIIEFDTKRCSINLIHPDAEKVMWNYLKPKFQKAEKRQKTAIEKIENKLRKK